MTRALAAGLLLGVALGVASPPAGAHPRATSLTAWEFRERDAALEARVTVRVPWSALQRVLPEVAGVMPERLAQRRSAAAAVDAYLLEHVRLRAAGAACAPRGVAQAVTSPDATHLARRFLLRCPPGPPELEVDLFHEADPSHLHLARARLPDGRELDRVIVLGQSRWAPFAEDGEATAASSVGDYLRLGVEHIASGVDHLVFVLALLLTGTGVAQLATVVTGFTVAHSLTLALGVLGWVSPVSEAVEALIGFSIVVVACENFAVTFGARARRGVWVGLAATAAILTGAAALGALRLPALALAGVGLFSCSYLALSARVHRVERLRWLAAFAFGLIHGFGFAGVLAEAGLPRENVLPALLGFNLGVEVGQLVVVAAGWLLLRRWLRGTAEQRARVIQWGSAPVLAAGVYWFLSRALPG